MKPLAVFAAVIRGAALCVISALALTAPLCHGQATTGQVVGQVTDPSGAVVPGATVTVTDESRGVTFTGRTDSVGDYSVVSLPPGLYTVMVTAPGFNKTAFTHVTLAIDQQLKLNFPLKLGNVATEVTVTDSAPLLQTQTAEVGTVIGGNAIVDLPLLGRNFYDLTSLVPGVSTVQGSINSFALSVSGQREFGNSVQLDGIESTTNRTQDVTVVPNVDSVDQFKVITASYNAEFGNAAGGVIAIQTKAGTNTVHGDAFEFFRPNFLAARTDVPGVTTPQPASVLKQHNFGGTLGGPIKRDHSFLFGAYEGVRMKDAYSYVDSTVPFGLIGIDPDGSVDFSGLVDPCSGQQCPNNVGPPAGTVDPIFDPVVSVESYGGAEQQFAGNVIPKDRVSPAGLATLLNFYPKPNLPGIENGWFRNFEVYSPVNQNTNHVDARFDQVISAKDHLYTVYHWQNDNQLVTDPYWGKTVVPGGGDSDQANKQDDGAQSISLTYDRVISVAALNEVRFGYLNYYQDQYSLLDGIDYSDKYGVGNVTVPGYPATVGYPDIYLADGYLAGGSTYKPYHVHDQNYQITDAFTWTGMHGHEFKFGGDLRLLNSRPNYSLFPTGFDFFDSYGYAETSNFYYTYIAGAYNWAGGSDLADLVLGLPSSVDIGLQLTKPHTKSWNLDYYAQDSWRASPRLTLNYGLRYEYQNPWTEANNYMSNYDLASGNILLAGRAGASDSLMVGRKNDLSPRFGFDYQIDPKTVVRAGFAIFYSPENDGREDILTLNAPFSQQASYSNWVYNGPATAPPASPWEYQLDTGVLRSTTINIPSSGVIVPSTLPNGNLETTYAVNPNMKSGTTGSFSFTGQRELTKSMSLEVGWVGSISRHLSYEVGDINANPNSSANSYDNRLTSSLGKIQYLTDAGNSDFNSMQVKFTKQASRNTSFLASYTWSHSLDNGPAPFNLGHINNDSPQNPYDPNAEYASSDSDLRHNFVFSGTFVLPVGKGERWGSSWGTVANAVLGGWHYSPIATLRSGNPVNVVRGNNPAGILPGLRPDVKGDPNLPRGQRTIFHYFDTADFFIPKSIGPSSFLPGDAGRNIVVGPGYINLDSSLAKDFKIRERFSAEFRAEAFNTFNTAHLAAPDGDANDGTFGQISRVLPASNRVAQLALKIMF